MRTWGIAAGFVCFVAVAMLIAFDGNFAGGAQPEPNSSAPAAQPSAEEGAKFYETQVRPIFEAHCYTCHGFAAGDDIKSGFNMTTRAGLIAGGDNGPAIE